jgi:competence protein ComEA
MLKVHIRVQSWALLAGLLASVPSAKGQSNKLPAGPGKDAFVAVCGACHAPEIVLDLKKSRDGWSATIDDMVAKGASGTDQQMQYILDYLSKNFGKSTALKIDINTASKEKRRQVLEASSKDAEAITYYRDEHGKFKLWDDLKKASEIDINKFLAKKDRITSKGGACLDRAAL